MLTKDTILAQLSRLSEFAESNLKQLEGLKLDDVNDTQDYYLGLIRRQTFFALDLSAIFQCSPHQSFISQFIISRCILDDYIHLIYAVNQPDVDEAIVEFNGRRA